MTGSSLPLRARSVRSRPYFSGDALTAAHALQGFENRVFRQPAGSQPLALDGIGQAEQNMLGRDVVILHSFGVLFRGREHIGGGLRKPDFHVRAVDLRAAGKFPFQFLAQSKPSSMMTLLQKGYCTAQHAKTARKMQNHKSLFKIICVVVQHFQSVLKFPSLPLCPSCLKRFLQWTQ